MDSKANDDHKNPTDKINLNHMIGNVIHKTAFEFGKVLTVCYLSKMPVNIYIAVCLCCHTNF
jgi:hypothetical protein